MDSRYNAVKTVPQSALKVIDFGKLKGKYDTTKNVEDLILIPSMEMGNINRSLWNVWYWLEV